MMQNFNPKKVKIGRASRIDQDLNRQRSNVCLCVFPFATQSTRVHAFSVAKILQQVVTKLYILTPAIPDDLTRDQSVVIKNLTLNMHPRQSIRPIFLSYLLWGFKYIAIQLEMCCRVLGICKNVDVVIFYEGSHYLLPAIAAKMMRKKIIKYSPGTSKNKDHKLSADYWIRFFSDAIEKIVFVLSDKIVTATEGQIPQVGKKKSKYSVAMYTYITDGFTEKINWNLRDEIIGYVGRLIGIRGIHQLVMAIPIILQEKKNVKFLIVGDGILMNDMKKYLTETGYIDRVVFTGWVPNDKIPDYLNEMKFHISPAFEDFPGTVNLEAMACGTIAIANAVDGVRDIMEDNETGFLVNDNEPRTIADKVVTAWNSPDLDEIRRKAKILVKERFSRQKVLDDWQHILGELQIGRWEGKNEDRTFNK